MGPLPPLAVGFFGLGTGYYIYGGWEFFGIPRDNSEKVSKVIGQWGIWMPGFMQFLAGTYLFLELNNKIHCSLFFIGERLRCLPKMLLNLSFSHTFPLEW